MATTRDEIRRSIESTDFDVCVIGGGATGAGCALDAQLRGLRTVLIEGADFASRTSSASTKMAHGGVRYLQAAVTHLDFRQFRLVRHALRERAVMLRNAPHLAGPQEFLVPCFSGFDLLFYGAGLKLYDRIAGAANLLPSRVMNRNEAVRRVPGLRTDGLRGAASYADGQFDDARYGFALVATFRGAGGHALNYAEVVGMERDDAGRIRGLSVVDRISDTSFGVRALVFVNATGPYSDSIRRLASPGIEPRLRPSKGVHVLFPLDDGWGCDGLLVPKTEDGRVVFALPYNGRLLVGTTDDAASPDTEMVVTRPEIDYLLRQINPYLRRPLSAAAIVSGFAGLRPLVRSRHAGNTSAVIRDDDVEVDATSGLISILGGKWTTYRLMAERTIDRVQKELGMPAGVCVTADTGLYGSKGYHPGYWRELVEHYDLSEAIARHLVRKYGTGAPAVLRLIGQSSELAEPLIDGALPIRAEVVYSARHEMAATVEDVLARRIGLELYDWRMARDASRPAARLMAAELGWSEAETERAAAQYISRLQRFLEAAALPESVRKN